VELRINCAEPQSERALAVTAQVITRGSLDLKNHSSATSGTPLVPGQSYKATWELHGKDYVIPAGHRIGLVLMSNDRSYITVDQAAGALTVALDGSSLDIPVVGGRI
jgi:X-Pro dipeptidyl-peptidase